MNNMTTLCYIEQDGKYLMMHRTKKENDVNKDKWVGVGGHIEEGESPEDCVKREILEETGLYVDFVRLRGLITFVNTEYPTEYMFLYTADGLQNEPDYVCDEGELRWIDKKEVKNLPIWAGDKIFLELLEENADYFSLKLRYHGEQLVESHIEWGYTKHDADERLRREKIRKRAEKHAMRVE